MRILSAVANALASAHLYNDMGDPAPIVAWAVTDDGRALPIVAGSSIYALKIGDYIGFDDRKDLVDVFLGRWFSSQATQRTAIAAAGDAYKEGEPCFPEGSFGNDAPTIVQNISAPAPSAATTPAAAPKRGERPAPVGPLGLILDGPTYTRETMFLYDHEGQKLVFALPPGQPSPKGDHTYKQTQDAAKELKKGGVPVWTWDMILGNMPSPTAATPTAAPLPVAVVDVSDLI